eukprot:Clim_evm12s191 gene=Clim_evmTU12s191
MAQAAAPKNRRKEYQQFAEQGLSTIGDTLQAVAKVDLPLEIHHTSKSDPKVTKLISNLTRWLNSYLQHDDIVVRDLARDLHDGILLAIFIKRAVGVEVPYSEVAQSERSMKDNIRLCLRVIEVELGVSSTEKHPFDVDGIYNKELPAVLHVLVALTKVIPFTLSLPAPLSINMLKNADHPDFKDSEAKVNKVVKYQITYDEDGKRSSAEDLTAIKGSQGDLSDQIGNISLATNLKQLVRDLDIDYAEYEYSDEETDEVLSMGAVDSFDILFRDAPEKLPSVRDSLLGFVNAHLNRLDVHAKSIDTDFRDGVYLILLLSHLANVFVPFRRYHALPRTDKEKMDNIRLAYYMMKRMGVKLNKIPKQDILEGEPKTTMRLLYTLYSSFRDQKPGAQAPQTTST